MPLSKKGDETFTIRACRICLDSTCGSKVLLNEENGWLQLFEYCFGLVLSAQDEPRVLCEKCADNVKKFAKFKQQCQKSDSLWKSVTCKYVKCYTNKITLDKIKNEVLENNDQNSNVDDGISFDMSLDNDPNFVNDEEAVESLSTKVKIEKEEQSFNISFDNDPNFLNDEEAAVVLSTEENELSVGPVEIAETQIEIDNGKLDDIEYFDNLDVKEENSKQKRTEDIKKENNNNAKTKVKEEFKCKMCKKIYEKKKWYLSHVKFCKTKKQKSQNQDFKYGRKSERTNNEIKDVEDTFFMCGLCNLNFTNDGDVRQHLREHWTNNDLQCKLCEFLGCDLAAISAHRYSHDPSKRRTKFLCHICGNNKRSLLSLQFHYRQTHLNKNGGFCSKCNKEFSKFRSWKKHDRIYHSNAAGYICDICGKRFIFKCLIKDHVIDHTNPKKHICDVCGKTFKRARYLKLHLTTVHTNSNPIKCTHCNKMYKSEYTLSLHQKLVAKEKQLKCEVCYKQFPTNYKLKSHMVMHTHERPHCCDICGARYKAKGQLKIHMRSHTGYLPYKCELCSKSFATFKQLKVHSSVHTGIRPHKCPYCDRTFHSRKLVREHCAHCHKTEIAEKNSNDNK